MAKIKPLIFSIDITFGITLWTAIKYRIMGKGSIELLKAHITK